MKLCGVFSVQKMNIRDTDIETIEINEAFAAQSLPVVKDLGRKFSFYTMGKICSRER